MIEKARYIHLFISYTAELPILVINAAAGISIASYLHPCLRATAQHDSQSFSLANTMNAKCERVRVRYDVRGCETIEPTKSQVL